MGTGDGPGRRSGTTYMVNNARVVCGDVPTRNATVFIIDTVLMPEK
ncbi:fasciclin domain-containing protein [Nonomuraea sp. NPDC051191]